MRAVVVLDAVMAWFETSNAAGKGGLSLGCCYCGAMVCYTAGYTTKYGGATRGSAAYWQLNLQQVFTSRNSLARSSTVSTALLLGMLGCNQQLYVGSIC